MVYLYHLLISQPINNAMIIVYNLLPVKDLGITIILLTVLIRLLLMPLSYKAARAQREIAKIQPKLKEVQKKFKDNREEQARQLMALYKEHQINPLTSIVPLLIQLPVLIALYQAFMILTKNAKSLELYSFVTLPAHINIFFLNLVNLAKPSLSLALLAGFLQFVFSKMMMIKNTKKKDGQKTKMGGLSGMMSSQMTYFMPFLTIFIALKLPASLPLYWATTTLFSIGEQWLVRRNKPVSRPSLKDKLKDDKPSTP